MPSVSSPRVRALPLLSALTLALAATSAFAATGDVWLEMPAQVELDESFVAELHAELGAGPYAASQFRLEWDPTLLELDITYGVHGVSGGPGQIGAVPPVVVNDLTPGVLVVNSLIIGSGLQGHIVVHGIGFRALAAFPGSAAIELEVEALVDPSGDSIPADGQFPHPAPGGSIEMILALPDCGDVDGDWDTDILDSLLIAQATVGTADLSAEAALRGDVDGDADLDIIDALFVARFTLGLAAELHCMP